MNKNEDNPTLKSKVLDLWKYFWRFGLVGFSGIFVNEGILALFSKVLEIPVIYSSVVAIELSIISNFLLNNYWTWKDRKEQSFWQKFFKYHAVTWASSGLVNWGILQYLHSQSMDELIANLIGIAFGTAFNFILSHFWTFKY